MKISHAHRVNQAVQSLHLARIPLGNGAGRSY